MTKHTFIFSLGMMLFALGGTYAQIEKMPVLQVSTLTQTKDWLIDPSGFTANLYRSENQNELILDNGLVRRVFRVAPNLATIAYKNLTSDQEILRSIHPEALLTINGLDFEVGGLKGKANQAFILKSAVEKMKTNPTAFQFSGFSYGNISSDIQWKQVRHHAPHTTWPPKGVELKLHFKLPPVNDSFVAHYLGLTNAPSTQRTPTSPSPFGRKALMIEHFEDISAKRTIIKTSSDERSSFNNEGKGGEIYTPSNSALYTEIALPKATKLVEATLFVGTDRSTTYSPGIAVVFDDNTTLKFSIQQESDYAETFNFNVFDGKRSFIVKGTSPIDIARKWTLRIREDKDKLYFDAKKEDDFWHNYYVMNKGNIQGNFAKVRLGKTDPQGGNQSTSGVAGDYARLKVEDFAAYSGFENVAQTEVKRTLEQLRAIEIIVTYRLYDGIPLIAKQLEIHNGGNAPITIDRLTTERLGVVERFAFINYPKVMLSVPECLYVETDYSFGGDMNPSVSNEDVIHWEKDPSYTSQVSYSLETPCLLNVSPSVGPAQDVQPQQTLQTYTTYELAYDYEDRERNALARKKMYRTIAPWATENPLMMHCVSSDEPVVKNAIDECAEVGFEMLILSFGSGFNMENEQTTYLEKWKKVAEYAHSKHIEIGAYSLFASRSVGGGNDVVSPQGTRPRFGHAPSLTSPWGLNYYRKIRQFYDQTGFSLLEHDGPYPGDIDITPRPPLQKGEKDSRWVQWRLTNDLYKALRAKGVYINAPDWYFLSGANKTGMGYREVNWSLPKADQVLHTRQNIYDGTWNNLPSMGWMFVPLTQYHGGGLEATIEPLNKNLDHYEKMLYSNLAFGVQACYRGKRLYDTDETKALVKKWVSWYKDHRDILESDLIHGVRANGSDIDWALHVNPNLKEKGMLVVFNPTETTIKKTIKVPLYYTGITKKVSITDRAGKTYTLPMDASTQTVLLPVAIPAQGFHWYSLQSLEHSKN